MKLNDYMKQESKKLRLIGYAKDGDTVVVHRVDGYNVCGNFYVYTTKPNDYGEYSYKFAVNYPTCNYALDAYITHSMYAGDEIGITRCIKPANEITAADFIPWKECIPAKSYYPAGEENFFKWMDCVVENHGYMRNTEIRLATEILKVMRVEGHDSVEPYVQYKRVITEERERKDQERKERAARIEAEREAEAKAQREAKISEVCDALRKDGDCIRMDFSYVPDVAERYGVKIPLRVKGWIMNKLSAIKIQDGKMAGYSYHKTSKRDKGSDTVWGYMDALIQAVRGA